MANIKVVLDHAIIDGQPVTFQAPCDCTKVTGLKVEYPGGYKVFTFKDAHRNALTGIGNLFAAGAYVKVILDVNNASAYIQNADTNAYLEAMFAKMPNLVKVWTNSKPDSNFKEQKITLDLKDCIGVFVRYKNTKTGSGYHSSGLIPMNSTTIVHAPTSSGAINQRGVRATTTGVQFYTATQSGSDSETVIIPTEIYAFISNGLTAPAGGVIVDITITEVENDG